MNRVKGKMAKNVKEEKRKVRELPQVAGRMQKEWQASKARSKIEWLEKKGFLSD